MRCESEVFEILEAKETKDPRLTPYIINAREEYERDIQSATDKDIKARFDFQYHITALYVQNGKIPKPLSVYYDKHRNLIDTIASTKSPKEIEAYIEDYRNPQSEELTPEIAA